MMLVPFFEIPYGNRLAKNVNSQYVQVIPRSTTTYAFIFPLALFMSQKKADSRKLRKSELNWFINHILVMVGRLLRKVLF